VRKLRRRRKEGGERRRRRGAGPRRSSTGPSRSTSRRRASRARSRARAAGDRAGALADLTAYVAREPNPEHLAEARALRAEIEDRAAPRGDRSRRPSCSRASACSRTSRTGRCARWAARARATSPPIGSSRSGWSTNTPIACRRRGLLRAGGARAARAGAGLARARTSMRACPKPSCARRIAGRWPRRRPRRSAPPSGRWRGSPRPRAIAAALRAHRARARARGRHHDRRRSLGRRAARRPERLSDALRADADVRRGRRRSLLSVILVIAVGLACSRVGAGAAARSRSALRRRPALFPDVARAVGELRHDVLKHRASVLGCSRTRTRRATRSSAR
jgi:hypothetical protein